MLENEKSKFRRMREFFESFLSRNKKKTLIRKLTKLNQKIERLNGEILAVEWEIETLTLEEMRTLGYYG